MIQTFDVPVTLRLTLDRTKVPDPLKSHVARAEEEGFLGLVCEGTARQTVAELLPQANTGASYLTISLL